MHAQSHMLVLLLTTKNLYLPTCSPTFQIAYLPTFLPTSLLTYIFASAYLVLVWLMVGGWVNCEYSQLTQALIRAGAEPGKDAHF